jgi:DNA repair exonuclease SbcCD ATPase subunit
MAQETTVAVKINASTGGTESVKSLKAQIREAKEEAIQMAREFGEFSPQATQAAAKVATLKDEMDDLNQRVNALNPEKFERIQTITMGLARGIQAATGAMALFGVENENATKTLVAIQGAMAFAEGIAGLLAMKAAFGAFFTSVIAGFRAMSAAMIATGIGAILVLIGSAVSMLIDLFDSQAEETKRLEAETRKLEQAYKDLASSFEEVGDNHDFITEKIMKNLERENASEAEILRVKKARNLERIDLLTEEMQKTAKKYDEEAAFIKKNTKTYSEEEKQLREMNKRKADQFEAFTKRMRDLRQSDALLAEDIQTAEQRQAEKEAADAQKRWEDYQRVVKAQQDAERNAIQALNEEKRKLREADITDAIQLERVKLQNELERLSEQRANALRADNLTNKAKADINAKFDASEQLARKNNQKAIDKIEADANEKRLQEQEKFAADRKALQEQEISDSKKLIDEYFKQRETAIFNEVSNEEERAKKLEALETERLERQLREMRDYGKLTAIEQIDLENQIAKRKAEIYKRDTDAKIQAELAKQAAEMEFVQVASQAIGQLGVLFKEGSDASKAAALTEIAINTAIGFIQGLRLAQQSAAATGPGAAVAFPIFYASQIAAVLGAAGRAKQILKGGGTPSSGGNQTPPNAPQTTPLTGGTLPDTEAGQFAGMGKVYVLEGDITKTQTRVRRVRNVSVV